MRRKASNLAYDRDDLQIQKKDNYFKINLIQNGSTGYSWEISQVSKNLQLSKIKSEDVTWFDPDYEKQDDASGLAYVEGSVNQDGHYQFQLDSQFGDGKDSKHPTTESYLISIDCQNGVITKITPEDKNPDHK